MTCQSVNPYDGKILKTFKQLTKKQLETALETAATCFETWRCRTFAKQRVVVSKAATIMRTRVAEFTRPVTREMGNLIVEARDEVQLSAKQTRCEPPRHRHGVHQSPDLDGIRLAVRRHQELRLWT
jgi:succinate-semialdehyde dehydrogenase/glutarate-semialdehyde dehydrogenase